MRVLWFAGLTLTLAALAQNPVRQDSTPVELGTRKEAQAAALATLTSEQRAQFDRGGRAFVTRDYPAALDTFRALLPELPPAGAPYALAGKYAAEAALNTGDRAFALKTLEPIAAANPQDWQAQVLLARGYAESGMGAERDAALARLAAIHKDTASPGAAGLKVFLIENIALPNGAISLWYSLEPWGSYHTYLFGRVYNQAHQQILRLALESGDADQPLFAKTYPELAARGEREFSLDGYGPDARNADGQLIQSHYTYGFFEGRPPYDIVRKQMIEAAEGERKPSSSRIGPVGEVPPPVVTPGVKN